MRLLLVDNQPIIHEAIKLLFADDLRGELMVARSCKEALQLVAAAQPDVVIIDPELPDGSGFDLVLRFKREIPTAGVVVYSRLGDPDTAWRCLQSGATGVVGKVDPCEDLRRCVLRAAVGESWLPERLQQAVAYMRISGVGSKEAFSVREMRILRALSRGKSLTEIAHENGISYKTVTNEVGQIRLKLGARTQPEMIRIAMEKRLLP